MIGVWRFEFGESVSERFGEESRRLDRRSALPCDAKIEGRGTFAKGPVVHGMQWNDRRVIYSRLIVLASMPPKELCAYHTFTVAAP
jgi:hypothetical protein